MSQDNARSKVASESESSKTDSDSVPEDRKDTEISDDTVGEAPPEGNHAEEESLNDVLMDMEKKKDAAEQKAQESHDRLLRVSAEFENYKKRSAREMEAFKKFANESLVRDLLSVVDNLERAIESSSKNEGTEPSVASIAKGVEMTHKEILKTFDKFGVKPIEAMEKPFDPAFHEAVLQEESREHPQNTVLREFQKGYMIHDRLLRPSMVCVSKAAPEEESNASGT